MDSRHGGSCPGLLTPNTEQARRTRELQGRGYLIHNALVHQQSAAQVSCEPVLIRLAIPPFQSWGGGGGAGKGILEGARKYIESRADVPSSSWV